LNRGYLQRPVFAGATPEGDILMPGEIEERAKAQRLQQGIEIDATTWSQLLDAARSVGLSQQQVDAICAN
jgi:uncharacterized oxidoreductase